MPHSFWPSFPCSRQAGRKTNTLALTLGIPQRKSGAGTETGHLGAERPGADPVAPCKDIRRVQQGCRLGCNLGGSSCMVKITPNAPNLDHAKKKFFTGSIF